MKQPLKVKNFKTTLVLVFSSIFSIALSGCVAVLDTPSETSAAPSDVVAFCESYVQAWNLYSSGQPFDDSFANIVDSPKGSTPWHEAANQLEVSFVLASLDPLEQGRLSLDSEDLLLSAITSVCIE